MDPSTISGATFHLYRGSVFSQNRVAATVSYDAAKGKAILGPDAPLARGARYVAKVTTGAKDLAGNPPAQNKSFAFTVRQ